MSDRTLIADRIINYTGCDLWVYGSSGDLVELLHEDFEIPTGGLPEPKKRTYYAVDKKDKLFFERDERYKNLALDVIYSGTGPNNKAIYKLRLGKILVVPVSGRVHGASDIYFHWSEGEYRPLKNF